MDLKEHMVITKNYSMIPKWRLFIFLFRIQCTMSGRSGRFIMENMSSARSLWRQVQRKQKKCFRLQRKIMCFLWRLFAYQHSPYIKEIKEVIDSGEIGELRYIEAALITSDYDHSNIRMRKETLGGCMYDLGVYAASFVQRMTGKEPGRIDAVSSFSEEKIDTFTTAVFEYESGMKAHIDCGMVLETEKNCSLDRFQIHGSKGSLVSVDFGFNAPGDIVVQDPDI